MKSRDILNQVIDLMAQDVADISKGMAGLEPEVALKLTRYSTALLAITKDLDEQGEKAKKGVEKLSTEELLGIARKHFPNMDGKE